MFKTYFLNSQKLPIVVEPRQKQGSPELLNDLALSNRDFFRAKLLEHGALLFRGFQVKVEETCRKTGIEYEWQADNCLRIRQTRTATCIHPETGEEVWFNQAHVFHTSTLDDERSPHPAPAGNSRV